MARITKSDLLLAGWHSVYYGRGGERWEHPKVLGTVPFREAIDMQKVLAAPTEAEAANP